MDYILEINDLNISFEILDSEISVIKNLSLNLKKGEILSIVGASGSGKSVFSHALMGILPENAKISGKINFNGKKISRKIRTKEFTLIPQTSSYLDPLMKIEKQVKLNDSPLSEKSRNLYPFQCSGGMVRNALFSLAYEKNLSIIIADEPTPGLDLETAIKTLQNLKNLARNGKSIILITHDIDLAINISDRVAVFYDGTILEIANSCDFSNDNLRHPYTKALFSALPQNDFISCDFPTNIDENVCFCYKKCEKFSDKCKGNIKFIESNFGMVRCNNEACL